MSSNLASLTCETCNKFVRIKNPMAIGADVGDCRKDPANVVTASNPQTGETRLVAIYFKQFDAKQPACSYHQDFNNASQAEVQIK